MTTWPQWGAVSRKTRFPKKETKPSYRTLAIQFTLGRRKPFRRAMSTGRGIIGIWRSGHERQLGVGIGSPTDRATAPFSTALCQIAGIRPAAAAPSSFSGALVIELIVLRSGSCRGGR